MAEYYRDITSYDDRRPKRRSVVGTVIDIIMVVVTVCVAALFVATLLVPVLGPEVTGWLSTVGLIAPFLCGATAADAVLGRAVAGGHDDPDGGAYALRPVPHIALL